VPALCRAFRLQLDLQPHARGVVQRRVRIHRLTSLPVAFTGRARLNARGRCGCVAAATGAATAPQTRGV
jgi:hypothetical protein